MSHVLKNNILLRRLRRHATQEEAQTFYVLDSWAFKTLKGLPKMFETFPHPQGGGERGIKKIAKWKLIKIALF